MSNARVVIAANREALAHLVADKFVVRVGKLLGRQPHATVVLTGGGVGTQVLAAVAAHPRASELDWSRVVVTWGDERFVAAGHPERNDRAAREALLDHVGIPEANIVTFPTTDDTTDIAQAAVQAQQQLWERLGLDDQPPQFDIGLVGMGPDGHVLSVFPGSPTARADSPAIVAVEDSPKPPAQRLTMTVPLFNRSARVWAVVSGGDKAAALGLALAGAVAAEVPAAGISGTHSTKVFIDEQLATLLPAELVSTQRFWSADDERADYVPRALRD